MREIKFRAWHKTLEKMLDANEWNNYGPVISRGEILSEYVELMQYTGLKDRNGREIYEGDVVKRPGFAGARRDIGKVIFEKGRFCIHWKRGEFSDTLCLHCFDSAIIGNIYENPGLLTTKEAL